MIRAFAIGLSIATMRLIFVPALVIIVATPTDAQIAALSTSSFAAAFVLHASVAELWIRATRRSGALRASEAKPHEGQGASGGTVPRRRNRHSTCTLSP